MLKNLGDSSTAATAKWSSVEKKQSSTESVPANSQQLLSTAIVAQFIDRNKSDYSQELSNLLNTPEAATLVSAAENLAESQNISIQEAMIQVVKLVKQLDAAWSNVLLREGLNRLGIE